MKTQKTKAFNHIALSLGLISSLLLGACTATDRSQIVENSYQPYCPVNFTESAAPLPCAIKRVAMMPICENRLCIDEQMLTNLDETFIGELQKTNKFEVVPVRRLDLLSIYNVDQFGSVDDLPQNLYSEIYKITGADAILFTDLTHFRPYKPVSMSIRSKLVDIKDGSIIWSIDENFDSGNPHVASAARLFQESQSYLPYPQQDNYAAIKSPVKFGKYVANAIYQTTPNR